MAQERLQKVMAAAGIAPRRECEQIILEGRVRVNGEVVRELPVMADPAIDHIEVDGRPLRKAQTAYYVLNKPRGILPSVEEIVSRKEGGGPFGGGRERVLPVGRLDADTTGLLILTNDGALAQKMSHPGFEAARTYRAMIDGLPSAEAIEKLKQGIWLSDGRTPPARVTIIHKARDRSTLEIVVPDDRNRVVNRMLAKVGCKTRRLARIRMGPISIDRLPLGAFRPLSEKEIRFIQAAAQAVEDRPARRRERRRGRATDGGRGIASQAKKPRVREASTPAKRGRRIIGPE